MAGGDGAEPTAAPAPDLAQRQTALLDAACDVLEELKAIVLAPQRSEGVENIYHKRHIAAGIPSMYGDYTEPKFDALGLSFRVEALVSRLLEDVAETLAVHYLSRISQRKLAAAMPRFERVLAIEGLPSRQLADHIALLDGALGRADFTFAQFRNIVQFLAQSVSDLTRLSILSHDQVLRTILDHDSRECDRRGLGPDAIAEAVLREVLVSALGVQTVDRYVAGAVQVMGALADRLDGTELTRMMHYDPKRLISWIDRPQPGVDDQITLGAKARGLKHLAEYGFNVPEGFILTTELFAAMPAMHYRPLYDNTIDRIRAAVTELEERTGRRLGDPERLLTLSIRSGAPVSMPGLMVTFPNVGLNDRLVEAMAADPAMAWTGVGLLPPLRAVVGDVGGRGPRRLRRDHDRVEGPIRRHPEAGLHRAARCATSPCGTSRSPELGAWSSSTTRSAR